MVGIFRSLKFVGIERRLLDQKYFLDSENSLVATLYLDNSVIFMPRLSSVICFNNFDRQRGNYKNKF